MPDPQSTDSHVWCPRHPKTQVNTAAKCILCLADEFFAPFDSAELVKVDTVEADHG